MTGEKDPRDVMQAEHDAGLSEHPAFRAPAEMPDDLVRKLIEIVEGAVNSAIPEPWEVSARASAAILALFAPILAEKEREIRMLAERWDAYGVKMENDLLDEREARLAAEAALAAERERCADIADMAAEREDARAFETSDDLHVAECRGAERAAKAIAAAIRAQQD